MRESRIKASRTIPVISTSLGPAVVDPPDEPPDDVEAETPPALAPADPEVPPIIMPEHPTNVVAKHTITRLRINFPHLEPQFYLIMAPALRRLPYKSGIRPINKIGDIEQ